MEENPEYSDSDLIRLLQNEMRGDLAEIDLPADKEGTIDFEKVNQWYLETEKIIRVFSNVLSIPCHQAINQLRYAGHHILKANTSPTTKQANLVEAFKHCKRAFYDAIDFYVYKINGDVRSKLPFLSGDSAVELEKLLLDHIKNIHKFRLDNGLRIDYYSELNDSLIEGLDIISKINEIIRKENLPQFIFEEKENDGLEIEQLKHHLQSVQREYKKSQQNLHSKTFWIAIGVAFILAFGNVLGLVYNNFHASNLKVELFPQDESTFNISSQDMNNNNGELLEVEPLEEEETVVEQEIILGEQSIQSELEAGGVGVDEAAVNENDNGGDELPISETEINVEIEDETLSIEKQ